MHMDILKTTFYKNLVQPVIEHVHSYYELHYITDGRTHITIEGVMRPIKTGMFFWTKPREKHYMRITPEIKPVSQYTVDVTFSPQDTELRQALKAKWEHERFQYIGLGYRTMFEQIRINSLAAEQFLKRAAQHRLYSFLFQFAIQENTRSALETDYIEAALQIMQSRFPHPLNIDLVCRKLGVSQSYFSRIFKQTFGEPPLRYYLKLRLDNAKYLLENSNVKVKEIAARLGFEDELYFSKLFKKWYGIAPSRCGK